MLKKRGSIRIARALGVELHSRFRSNISDARILVKESKNGAKIGDLYRSKK